MIASRIGSDATQERGRIRLDRPQTISNHGRLEADSIESEQGVNASRIEIDGATTQDPAMGTSSPDGREHLLVVEALLWIESM